MIIENRTARILVVSLLILLLIPLVVMLGMMLFGSGMMAQMSGLHMGAGAMALCVLWTVLIAAALVGLIVLLTHGDGSPRHREIPSANMRSPLAH
ncbi:MAG TPA: hypothetical protein VFC10_06645 [Terriglobia bacterium]|nr:hypothetical protein [Terriglobia bacterium]